MEYYFVKNKHINFLLREKTLLIAILVVAIMIALLLLFGHTHKFEDWEVFREASCAEFGIEIRYCSCGESQEKTIDKKEHTEGEWKVDDTGKFRKLLCSVCSSVIKSEYLNDHTHSWSDWTTIQDPSCEINGLETRLCDCGAKQENIITATGHNFGDWKVVLEPSCNSIGKQERSCECGTTLTEDIPQLTHAEGNAIFNGFIKEYYCIHCNDLLRQEDTLVYSEGLKYKNDKIIGIGTCKDSEVIIPPEINGQNITIIGKKAFQYSTINGIILSHSIITVEERAFYESNIEEVYLGNGLTQIGERAFGSCSNLKTISIPSGISILNEATFEYCTSLKSIYLPNSINRIEAMVFYHCNSLEDIYFDGSIDEWFAIEKNENWNIGMYEYTIHCNDGDIQ